jgi:thiamine-monophosphate kinase
LIETIVTGGDDYEILATVAPDRMEAFRTEASVLGVAVTEIGAVLAGAGGARIIGADGKPLALTQSSFSHF